MDYEEVLDRLKAAADEKSAAGMAGVGIDSRRAWGVKIPVLRSLAREIGRNDDLARRLWCDGRRETMILASMIADPAAADEALYESWAADFYDWETCDQCCMNLFEKTPLAWRKAAEWPAREEEFVKRAGFVLMARLAVSDKKAADDRFRRFFELIEREAGDDRNMVKKGVNWALRQIGKRSRILNREAAAVAERLSESGSRSARWIGSDACRELTDEKVIKRLKR